MRNRTTLSKLFNFSGIEVTPAVALDYAKFKPDANKKDTDRTIPIYSLDIKANLYKDLE